MKISMIGIFAVFCILFAASASAFTCDDINPKTGRWITEYSEVTHKLSEGRDIITTIEHARVCKKIDENDYYYIALLTNADYGDVGLLECDIIRNDVRSECDDDLIDTYLDGTIIYLPTMDVGDSIEYSYQEDIEFPADGEVWSTQDIYLESSSPIEEMVLKIEVPETMDFSHYSSKQEPETWNEGDKKVYSWGVKDVPYYEIESLMPPLRHSLSRVSFTSFDSWDDVGEWFEKLFREAMKAQYVEEDAEKLTKDARTNREKVEVIYEWVRDNITYETYGFSFLAGYKPRDLDEILIDESGDCKGQTALLTTMLNSAGITAHPVVVSYRDITKDVPGPYSFYHTVTYVPDVDGGMWLDPTCEYCPAGHLPIEFQNLYSMILLDGKDGFTPTLSLPTEQASRTVLSEEDIISNDGSGVGDMGITFYGDMSYMYQDWADEMGIESIESVLEEGMDEGLTGKCGDVSIENLTVDIRNGSMDMNLSFTCKRFATKSGEKLVISSGGDTSGSFGLFSEVVAKDERRFPIWINYEFIVDIDSMSQLPPCYGMEELLPEVNIDESFVTITGYTEYDTEDNTLKSSGRVQFHMDEIPAENFAYFKEIISNLTKPFSMILYPQADEVSEKIDEMNAIINGSPAENETKNLWKAKVPHIDEVVESGKCQKVLDELSSLEEDIKSYRPKKIEKFSDEKEGGLMSNVFVMAGIAVILLLAVIVLVIRMKSRG